jgi:hypothetical protein
MQSMILTVWTLVADCAHQDRVDPLLLPGADIAVCDLLP